MLENLELERFAVVEGENALSLTKLDGTEALLTTQRLIIREIGSDEKWSLPLIEIERLMVIGVVIDDDWPMKWEIRLWFREPLDDDEERDTWGDLIMNPVDSTQGFTFGAELARLLDQLWPKQCS